MKRTRLRPMSKKREAAAKEYAKRREAFLASRPTCERCKRRASRDVHHSAGRHGTNYLDTATWFAFCRACHDEVHRYPSQARATGFLR
jgi:hypothetical protein